MIQTPFQIAPWDAHNQRLASAVRPAEWRNPTPADRYDLVVVGAGTAGLVSAAGAAGLGANVALVERQWMGGDCLNVGCVPSKALIRAARAAALIGRAAEFGMIPGEAVRIDFAAVMERMRRLRADLSPNDSADRFQRLGVDVFFGQARFLSRSEIEVEGEKLRFARAIIATGTRPAIPDVPGLQESGCLTNETVFTLTTLPRRLAIVGAGPIGCELAQVFRRFGSEVWQLESKSGILTRDDRQAADVIRRRLEAEGVVILCGSDIERVEPGTHGRRIHIRRRENPVEIIEADAILVAAGRRPNVEGLGLESAGVEFDERGVCVDDFLRTTQRGIYAAGDVCLPAKFTHVADATARIAIQNALFAGRKRVSRLIVPWCTYTQPEIAHVGMSEEEARAAGRRVEVFVQRFEEVDRAVIDGETGGFVKVISDARTGRVYGATIVADHAGDLISEITTAMHGGLGLKEMSAVIHPYPTLAEAIRKLGDAFNRRRLTPRVRRLLEAWLRWRR